MISSPAAENTTGAYHNSVGEHAVVSVYELLSVQNELPHQVNRSLPHHCRQVSETER